MYLQKVISIKIRRKKIIFCWRLEGHWGNRAGSEARPEVSQRFNDPDPYQNVTDPEHWLLGMWIVPVPCVNGRRAPCPGFPGYHLRTPHLVTPTNIIIDTSSDPDATFHVTSDPSPDPRPNPKIRPSKNEQISLNRAATGFKASQRFSQEVKYLYVVKD